MSKPKSDYAIQTVSNALRLLEAFREHDELGVSELARALALHKNNVFRLLATLEERGYIEQCGPSERYRLGPCCLELGRAYHRGQSLTRLARPLLVSLAEAAGECAHLGVLERFEVVHLDGEMSRSCWLGALRVGARMPAHSTALGKVLLGCASDGRRQAFDREQLLTHGLAPSTEATITDRDKLFEHLSGVSLQGFALDLEESEPGLCCAAAPIFDESGEACAALSVSGPRTRLSDGRLLEEVVPAVRAAADQLSNRLGSRQRA